MKRSPLLPLALLLPALGCQWSDQPAAPAAGGAAECAEVCERRVAAALLVAKAGEHRHEEAAAPKGGLELSAFEETIFSDLVTDLRAGVRPWDAEGLGVCKGQSKTCDGYLGMDAGTLPPGEYMVRAELAVPNLGPKGTWSIALATECVTRVPNAQGGVDERKSSRSRTYDVAYAGPTRGYRLSPLHTIKSPNPEGEEQCSFTVTAPHPDGDKTYTGSWTVPQG